METKEAVIVIVSLLFFLSGCNSSFKFEGTWKIIYLYDQYYTVDRKPLSNMIIINNDEDGVNGRFPITLSDPNGLASSLKDMTFFREDAKKFVVFKTVNAKNIFNDTFQIIYANRDSFHIRSRAIDLKCIKM